MRSMDGKDLSSIIKRARDIMRKDAGLSTDVDRIPQLSWILFLKAFDDLEKERVLLNPSYREAIEAPYRWRDWAADEEKGRTGDELIDFVNSKLFPYLRGLFGTVEKDQRAVIAEVFREIYNSMRSGYLLRDIINLVNSIDFTSSDDIHTIAHLYESMLKEMRDAAGTNGEFYTPRPVIRFIVNQIRPQIGEKILDPALGTGGFLTESYEYMKNQQKKAEDREVLQHYTLFGIEKKPMPYLLGMMNLILHGIEKPNVKRDNALRLPITEITEKDRVDVIMTNPPFGGEEEKTILDNFPEAMRTSETSLLFLQYIMRKLKDCGRCGMVVPNGALFDPGAGARIRKELLDNFNLHTIIRLPSGVFAPYAGIETNLLFFDRTGATREIWCYEHPLPEERQEKRNPSYTKTQPLQYREFASIQKWWSNREENDFAWKVSIEEVQKHNYSLDLKNPRAKTKRVLSPKQLLDDILGKEERFIELAVQTRQALCTDVPRSNQIEHVPLSQFGKLMRREVEIKADRTYRTIGCRLYGEGVYQREEKSGNEIKAKRMFLVKENDLVVNRIWAQKGSAGIVPPEISGSVVTQDFPVFELDTDKAFPKYIAWYLKTKDFQEECKRHSHGTSGRQRLSPDELPKVTFPLCKLPEQQRIVARIEKVDDLRRLLNEAGRESRDLVSWVLDNSFKNE